MSEEFHAIYEDYLLNSIFSAVGIGFKSYSDSIKKKSVSPESRKGEIDVLPCERFHGWESNYSQIAETNALELIKQEEQAKLKAEKKKVKKKRQREKKKEYNEHSFVNGNEQINYSLNKVSNNTENIVLNTDNKEAEGIDINAAFVNTAVKKLKNNAVISVAQKNEKKIVDRNYLIKTALDYENKEHYKEAIKYLSDAITLSPKGCDLLLKRSFIYYQLAKFKKSIRDAEKVLEYAPNNIEAYYRLGEGHFAMNNLLEAETAFTKLLSLDAYTIEASKRLFSIRIKQLEVMGYDTNEAFTALLKSKNKTLDEAIEFLTALENGKVETDDLYYSDEEDSEEDYDIGDSGDTDVASGPLVEAAPKPNIKIDKKSPLFTDPSNPTQCCSLFVGNLKKDVTYKEIEDVFIRFGDIESIKLVTEPNCYGFVNYKESSPAGCAMQALQGSQWLLSTVPLTIRYPTNTTINSLSNMKNPELIMNKFTAVKSARPPWPEYKPLAMKPISYKTTDDVSDSSGIIAKKHVPGKPCCPSQTEDCHFWRTTGCIYGNKCFKLHRPGQKGIELNYNKSPPHIQ